MERTEVIIPLALGFIIVMIYVLYVNGLCAIRAIRAVSFFGNLTKYGVCKATVAGCSGYIKRIIKFNENGIYQYILESNIKKGDLEVRIFDTKKEQKIVLNKEHPKANITVKGKQRYYMLVNFQTVTGTFTVSWQCQNRFRIVAEKENDK